MMHELKCWPRFFEAVWNESKPFEVRRDDRGFRVGDELWLREYEPGPGTYPLGSAPHYTGRSLRVRVSSIVRPEHHEGVAVGHVVMGLDVARMARNEREHGKDTK